MMSEEAVYIGVDVSTNTLDIADSSSRRTRQFVNEDAAIAGEGIKA